MHAGEDEQGFVQSVFLQAPPDTVWEALRDPYALSWMVVGCSYTTVAPPLTGVEGELRCWWRRCGYRSVATGVFEVVVLEPFRRVRYLELAARALKFELLLESHHAGSRVDITGSWTGFANEGAIKKLVRLWARQLPLAVAAGPIPTPPSPLHLLDPLGFHPHETAHSIDISAPLDSTWAIAHDSDGTLLNQPGVMRTWRERIEGAEVFFSIQRRDDGYAFCNLGQVAAEGQHHAILRGLVFHEEHQLVPHGDGSRLTVTMRWARSRQAKRTDVDVAIHSWLSRVKAAAEDS